MSQDVAKHTVGYSTPAWPLHHRRERRQAGGGPQLRRKMFQSRLSVNGAKRGPRSFATGDPHTHTHTHALSSAHTLDPSSNVISEDSHDAGIFGESGVEGVLEGLCDLRQSVSEDRVSSDCGVRGFGKGKGAGSVGVGVGGSEIGGSGMEHPESMGAEEL